MEGGDRNMGGSCLFMTLRMWKNIPVELEEIIFVYMWLLSCIHAFFRFRIRTVKSIDMAYENC